MEPKRTNYSSSSPSRSSFSLGMDDYAQARSSSTSNNGATAARQQSNLTASGPPLPVLLNALEKLRDQRTAALRDDMYTRYNDIQQLKAAIEK